MTHWVNICEFCFLFHLYVRGTTYHKLNDTYTSQQNYPETSNSVSREQVKNNQHNSSYHLYVNRKRWNISLKNKKKSEKGRENSKNILKYHCRFYWVVLNEMLPSYILTQQVSKSERKKENSRYLYEYIHTCIFGLHISNV